jgi:hypothetical protein
MSLKAGLLRAYFALEGAYYSVADFLDRSLRLPVYKYYITPIERSGVPSFPVTALLIIAVAALAAFLVLQPAAPAAAKVFCVHTTDGSTVYARGPGVNKSTVAVKGKACFEGLPEDVKLRFSIEHGGVILYDNESMIKDLPTPWTPPLITPPQLPEEKKRELPLLGPEKLDEPPEIQLWNAVDSDDLEQEAEEEVEEEVKYAEVKVKVVDSNGSVINVDTYVALKNANTSTTWGNTTTRGSPATFFNVPVGLFKVRAYAHAYGFDENSSAAFAVNAQELEITVVLKKIPEGSPNATVRALASGTGGGAIANAEVKVWRVVNPGLQDQAIADVDSPFAVGNTNSEGKFSFGPVLTTGTYLARVKKDGYFYGWKKFVPGAANAMVDVSLERIISNSAELHVTAFNYSTGTAVSGANVSAYVTIEGIEMPAFASTGKNGEAVFPSSGAMPLKRGTSVAVVASYYNETYYLVGSFSAVLDASKVYKNVTLYPPKGSLRLRALDSFDRELTNVNFSATQKNEWHNCSVSSTGGCTIEVYAGSELSLWTLISASAQGYVCFDRSSPAFADSEEPVTLTCLMPSDFICRDADCGIDPTGVVKDEMPHVGARILPIQLENALGDPMPLSEELKVGGAYRVRVRVAVSNASSVGLYLRAGGAGNVLNSPGVLFGMEKNSIESVRQKLQAARGSDNYSTPGSACDYEVVSIERLETPDKLFKWMELEVNSERRTYAAFSAVFYLFINPFYCGKTGVSCQSVSLNYRGFAYDKQIGKYKRVPFDPVLKYAANVTLPSG